MMTRTIEERPVLLQLGESQRLAIFVNDNHVGYVGQHARDRGREWFWTTENGGYGNTRWKWQAVQAVVEIMTRKEP